MNTLTRKRFVHGNNNLETLEPPTKKIAVESINMFCWGSTVYGELSLGGIEEESIFVPREVDFKKASMIKDISCGNNYTVVLTEDNELYSCGNNDYGQLGHDKLTRKLQLIPGFDAFVFKKVVCGDCHTLALNNRGQLFSWGCNSDGQLGLNSDAPLETTPKMVEAFSNNTVVQVACGNKHTIALTSNGDLYAWGSNIEGQVCGASTDEHITKKPKLIKELKGTPIVLIASGGYHNIVLAKSGAVYVWGKNTIGQLGFNGPPIRILPYQLKTLRDSKVRYVACGEDFTAFLTADGGVFTCGDGTFGQLGHGTTSNEILPRQIIELKGSVVTQISCGKHHMLAFVPSRGRVYAWGLGAAGQLGIRVACNVATPQVVLGPWVSPNGVQIYKSEIPPSEHNKNCVVKRIFAGGNHCFATVTKQESNIPPDDCRVFEPSSQIFTVTEEQLLVCQKIPMNASLDDDLVMYLKTVFGSEACFNASFPLPNDCNYDCTKIHSGVDSELAARLFGIIADLQNNAIQKLIFKTITEELLRTLVPTPPSIESLRVYIILPLYHEFIDPENCKKLQYPFAKAFNNLESEAKEVIENWLCRSPTKIFYRLIRSYKFVVLLTLKNKKYIDNIKFEDHLDLKEYLKLLKYIYKLNQTDDGLRVPYNVFYLPELASVINIQGSYIKWMRSSDTSTVGVSLVCNYPFLFDTQAKVQLLETDRTTQMYLAIREAATKILENLMFNPFFNTVNDQSSQYLMLTVSRENIVADTLKELSQYDSNDFKRPLRVRFHGEEAEDAGGVQKEFFLLLSKEILDPKYGMFEQYEETHMIWFSENSLEDEMMYYLIGIVCGLMIYNFIIINLPFPLALYKKLLREPVGLADLKDLSPVIANSLQSLLDYNEPDCEEVFGLNFEVTRQVFGEQRVCELIPNGSKIPVTLERKEEFVNLYVDYIFNKSIQSHFNAFCIGFHKVCGGVILNLFHSDELMALVVGHENYDWKEFEENTTYKEGYSKNDPTIVLFWEVFHELPLDKKKQFLLFLTGSDRIPIQGMAAIKITIQPMADEKFLPVAHTCFNLLDLPRYQTKARLTYKLLLAIQQTEGFSLV